MKRFCVVYIYCGVHYRYRCNAENEAEAKKLCKKHMGITTKDILYIEREG